MNRRHVAVLVLLGWIGVMGWLVRREYFRPRAALLGEAAAVSVTPGATYYALNLAGEQVGFASSLVDTLSDTVRVEDQGRNRGERRNASQKSLPRVPLQQAR